MNSAEGTWPYSIEEISRAIQMGVGRPIVGWEPDGTFFQLGGIGSDVTIQLIYEDEFETTVIVESEQAISNNGFNPFFPNLLGFNFDAIADSGNCSSVMNHIIANLNILYDSGELNKMREEHEFYESEEYFVENEDFFDEGNEYYDEDEEYYDNEEDEEI